MFACIYFVEDASLSVVGANDKNLEKLGDFGPREEVRMKWGKKTYHGTIVKVDGLYTCTLIVSNVNYIFRRESVKVASVDLLVSDRQRKIDF